MKNAKLAFAAIAVFTAVATMSFTGQETTAQNDDCWSSRQRHQNNLTPDLDQDIDCTGLIGECCVKPNPNSPGGYDVYGFPEM